MQGARNEMRREALAAMGRFAQPRLALVDAYDPSTYSAKVLLQPDGTGTGWLPIASQWVGNGWGFFSPPSPGDQVVVLFQEGSVEAGIIVGGLFSDADRPVSVPAGEALAQHQSGAFLHFHADGSIEVSTTGALKATVGGDLQAAVTGKVTASATEFDFTGPLNVTGPITSTSTITAQGDVVGQGTSLHGHTHKGVQSGSSNSGPPN